MPKFRNDILIVVAAMLYIAANAFFVSEGNFLLVGVPFVLIVGVVLLFAPNTVFWVLVFLIPLSIPLRRIIPGLSFDFWVPTEPVIFAVMLLVFANALFKRSFEKRLLTEPVFYAILFLLGWIAIAIIPSEMPIVSAKYLLSRTWFVVVFFYFGYSLFQRNPSNIRRFLLLFGLGLTTVALITLVNHAGKGLLNQRAAHGACTPFFIDHTSYGAALAFGIPAIAALLFTAKRIFIKFFWGGLLLFLLVAMVFSYSRAAWLSLIFAGGIWVIYLLRIRFKTVAMLFVGVVLLFVVVREPILNSLEKNTTESSGDLKEHLVSMVNISTDASNMERINRWNAAIRMFNERPFFGWGPGTYMFLYAPFQRSYQKTIISTNFGTLGNAHSEYLGLLSESGLPSVLGYSLILVFTFLVGFRSIRQLADKRDRIFLLASMLGLLTYVVHGFLNNFLDVDKIAAPFWAYIAMVLAICHTAPRVGSGKKQHNEGLIVESEQSKGEEIGK